MTGRLRRFAPADREVIDALWSAALAPAWPPLPEGIALLGDGLLAVDEGRPVGFVGVERAGGVPLLIVHPEYQRRGIGIRLIDAALELLGAGGVTRVSAGSGGSYIWPGVPLDLPAAVGFFAAAGWAASHDTLDLVADLRRYRPPAGVETGVRIEPATESGRAAALAFESSVFPSWSGAFESGREKILVARNGDDEIVGSLLFGGPGGATVFAAMLGPDAGTIGCVGVAPAWQGRGIGTAMVVRASEILRDVGTGMCHIGWVTRESFYVRAGYRPWRRYRMFHTLAEAR